MAFSNERSPHGARLMFKCADMACFRVLYQMFKNVKQIKISVARGAIDYLSRAQTKIKLKHDKAHLHHRPIRRKDQQNKMPTHGIIN